MGWVCAKCKKSRRLLALINDNEIPVFKGHILTDDDLLMRKHILNLMCKSQTTWSDLDLLNDNFINSLNSLHQLEADGLVVKHNNQIEVTKLGERFLRNICVVFDARLREKNLESVVFSRAN